MPQYLIIKPDGSLGYTSEKPRSGPVITKEQGDAFIATRGYSSSPEIGLKRLAEDWGLKPDRIPEPVAIRPPELEDPMGGITTATANIPRPAAGVYAPYGLSNTTGLDPNRFGATSKLPEEFQTSTNYSNLYSPANLRKMDELEEERTAISIDPTLDEDVRQTTLDEVDVQKSRIPQLSPMMREPTAQEKFGQRIVEVIKGPNREYYYFDDKNNPHLLETGEETKARDEAYLKTFNKHIDIFNKLVAKDEIVLSPKEIVKRAKYLADITHRRPEEERGAPPGQQGAAVRTMRGPDIEDYYFDKSGKPISLTELKKIYKGKREQWETLFDSVLESLRIANENAILGEEVNPEQLADEAESMTNEIFEQGGKVPKTKVKKNVLDLTDEEIDAELRKLK